MCIAELATVGESITEEDLKGMGLKRLNDRKRLLRAIGELPYPHALKDEGKTRVLGIPRKQKKKKEYIEDEHDEALSQSTPERRLAVEDPLDPGFGYDPFLSPEQSRLQTRWEYANDMIEAKHLILI